MMDETQLLARLNSHLLAKYGLRNTKGAEILTRRCHIDTVLLASDGESEIWKSLTIEPVKEHGDGHIFRITCDIEEDLAGLGVTKKSRTEELLFTGGQGHSKLTRV